MSSTEEKLDALIRSMADLKKSHDESRLKLDEKLKKLEEDVAATQEDVTERMLRQARRDRLYEFQRKGHEEQFAFNKEVGDRIEAAAKRLSKLAPPSEKDKATV